MPVTDFRQRTAMLFIAVVLGHIILISAQVNSSAGVPLLEVVTFGAFAEVQRGAAGLTGSIRESSSELAVLKQRERLVRERREGRESTQDADQEECALGRAEHETLARGTHDDAKHQAPEHIHDKCAVGKKGRGKSLDGG